MNLRVYKNKPVNWFDDFAHSVEHFWDTPFRKWEATHPSEDKNFSPACDYHETKDYFFFSFDIPGVQKKDLHIEFSDNTLHISGEKKSECREKKIEGQQFHEKFYGKFQRSFTLPAAVKEEVIEAHFKNGVLELLIPKAKASKGRTISVTDDNTDGLFSRILNKKSA